jgi:adenylate cyclase
MTAATACRTCGTEPREGARFCDGCGAPVTAQDTHAEYKQVTVLFADVVHSMDIAAAVGAERLREIMAELFDRSSAVVQRYGGTVDKFTGDGIMAVFGAPVALEDHAVRACLAALGIQQETTRLAAEVKDRDGVDLQLRVGLNSGQVIAGEIGSRSLGYTAVGEQVGMAQRMESVAPPGGVMLSESTVRLVQPAANLAEPEMVHIKGTDEQVPAQRLLGVTPQHELAGLAQTALVGRDLEVATIAGLMGRSASGRGCVVCVTGPAGIGKTRLVGEAVRLASSRDIAVFSTFCESHATDIAFNVVARLLRVAVGLSGLDDEAARRQVHSTFSDAGTEDLLLLYDLLGIRDESAAMPNIEPDARRRRLTALINSMSLASTTPALYVIEDAHWIDEVSESMLADFLAVMPQTHFTTLITYRPEYRGALAYVSGAQTISLAPLADSETTTLLDELVGSDPSVAAIKSVIAGRVAGNPFFAQEIVRELAERRVLEGRRGEYTCRTDISDVSVPGTLHAAIAARIDRLGGKAKKTLNAAAVIGSRFSADMLKTLGIDPVVDDLVRAELIDQVRFTPYAEYAFHNPLVRTVAYESQLNSDRAQLHRRVASTIEHQDQNAALLAEHLEAAGDLDGAYDWHMRAAAWAINRDINAARLSWERARHVADALPADEPDRTAKRIAPRTMLCGTNWRGTPQPVSARFEELRELCAEAGDKASLAIGMTGPVAEHYLHGRMREGSRLASEQIALIESIGDPALMIGAAFSAVALKSISGEMADVLRWSQTAIDWAGGDPAKGSLVLGSPLAVAFVFRGAARWWSGRPGWREDLDEAAAIARNADPMTLGLVVAWKYGLAVANGVLRVDDSMVDDLEEALQIAEASSDDNALGTVTWTLATILLYRGTAADRERGLGLLEQVREMCLQQRFPMSELPLMNLYAAREEARGGGLDQVMPVIRKSVHDLSTRGQFIYFMPATAVLVEVLVERATEADLEEAEAAVERLADIPGAEGWVVRDVMLLRLRALLARARGDTTRYRDYRDRYRDMGKTLGFEGHIAWAEAMP